MLGWRIVIRQGQSDEREHTLADWEAGLSGLRWIEELIAAGKAQQLRSDGYPNRYQARAADVLPLIEEVTSKIDFTYKLFKPKFRQERIAACTPDEWVTISAWDQS